MAVIIVPGAMALGIFFALSSQKPGKLAVQRLWYPANGKNHGCPASLLGMD